MPTSSSSRNKSHGSDLATFRRNTLSSSSFASSTSSSFASSTFFAHTDSSASGRAYSGHHINEDIYSRSSPSVRLSIDNRPISPNRSISFTRQANKSNNAASLNGPPKRTCTCSPTTHPGSFRCALHKRTANSYGGHKSASSHHNHSSSRLNCRRSAMTNSIVRIGGVEGELIKRALTALIRPSSHHQRRRAAFEPRPSRLSIMSKADGL